jgi:hypothetical protein
MNHQVRNILHINVLERFSVSWREGKVSDLGIDGQEDWGKSGLIEDSRGK